MGNEPQRERDHGRHANGNQKVCELDKDIIHRLTMRPG